MAETRHRRTRRLFARVAVPALLALATLVLTPGTGWATGRLTFASPADGAALSRPPADVLLEFSAPPDPGLSHVSARDSAGAETGTGDPSRYGGTGLRLPVSIRSAGDYTVAYHVVFADSSDVIGVLRFSVGTGVPPSPLAANQIRQARQAVADSHVHTVDPLSGTLLVADVVVLVGVVLALMRRPRPNGRPPLPDVRKDQP